MSCATSLRYSTTCALIQTLSGLIPDQLFRTLNNNLSLDPPFWMQAHSFLPFAPLCRKYLPENIVKCFSIPAFCLPPPLVASIPMVYLFVLPLFGNFIPPCICRCLFCLSNILVSRASLLFSVRSLFGLSYLASVVTYKWIIERHKMSIINTVLATQIRRIEILLLPNCLRPCSFNLTFFTNMF